MPAVRRRPTPVAFHPTPTPAATYEDSLPQDGLIHCPTLRDELEAR